MPIIVDPIANPGSTLNLCAVFFNAADDPADFVALERAGESLNVTTSARVEVRQLANRTRAVRRTGVSAQAFQATFEEVTPDEAAWLRAHVGEIVCIRDHVGTKFHGIYAEVPREVATGYRTRRDADAGLIHSKITLSIQQVTYSEAV